MLQRSILSAALVVAAVLASGCTRPIEQLDDTDFPLTPPLTEEWDKPLIDRPYRIQVGDELGIRFLYDPDLDDTVTVRPDGRISLVPVDDVDAAGRTPEELDAVLTERFGAVVNEAVLSVIVREHAAQRAYVGGEVMAPRVIALNANESVFTALMQAGGMKNSGAIDNILLIRRGAGQRWFVKSIDLMQIMQEGTGDVRLAAYDIIFVPRTAIADVGVFVEQYINQIVPRGAGFNAIYNINPETEITGP